MIDFLKYKEYFTFIELLENAPKKMFKSIKKLFKIM